MESSARAEEKELGNEYLRLQIELASQHLKLSEQQERAAERQRRIREDEATRGRKTPALPDARSHF